MYWLRRMRYLLQSRGHHHYLVFFISTLQERMAEYAYGAAEQGRKSGFHQFSHRNKPDCDCAPWHDASLVPDIIGILGGHDIVAIDKASADLIKKSEGLQNSRLQKAFSPGEDKFLDVHPQARWEIQINYGESIGLGNKNYELKNFPK